MTQSNSAPNWRGNVPNFESQPPKVVHDHFAIWLSHWLGGPHINFFIIYKILHPPPFFLIITYIEFKRSGSQIRKKKWPWSSNSTQWALFGQRWQRGMWGIPFSHEATRSLLYRDHLPEGGGQENSWGRGERNRRLLCPQGVAPQHSGGCLEQRIPGIFYLWLADVACRILGYAT